MTFRPGIAVALVLGFTLVGGVFILEKNKPHPVESTSIVNTNTSLRTFIPVTDNDDNSLPDWQDQLSLPTVNLDDGTTTMTQTAYLAVDIAAQSLYTNEDTSFDINDKLRSINNDTPYTQADITIGNDDSQLAWRTYGNRVAIITFENAAPAGTQDEMTVLNSALLNNDPTILDGLTPIITSYEGMIEDMLNTEVPSSLVTEHLSILNIYQAILIDLKSFKLVFEDAFPAMTRFSRYQTDSYALYTAISNLYLKLHSNGIQWSGADAASRLIKIEETH